MYSVNIEGMKQISKSLEIMKKNEKKNLNYVNFENKWLNLKVIFNMLIGVGVEVGNESSDIEML